MKICKNIFLVSLLFFFINIEAQERDVEYINEWETLIYQPIETERLFEQSKIKTYNDLSCTFWAPELDQINSSNFDNGFIFLPNNIVLFVSVIFIPYSNTETSLKGYYNIYLINNISRYEIIDEKLIFNLGIPVISLEDSSLYITYDNINFKKYRFEQKFENRIDIDYSRETQR